MRRSSVACAERNTMGVVAVLETLDGKRVVGLADPAGGRFDAAGDFDRLLPDAHDGCAVWGQIDPYATLEFRRVRCRICSTISRSWSPWHETDVSGEVSLVSGPWPNVPAGRISPRLHRRLSKISLPK